MNAFQYQLEMSAAPAQQAQGHQDTTLRVGYRIGRCVCGQLVARHFGRRNERIACDELQRRKAS